MPSTMCCCMPIMFRDDRCKNEQDPVTDPSYCHPRGGGTIGGALLRGRDRLRKKDLHTSRTSRSVALCIISTYFLRNLCNQNSVGQLPLVSIGLTMILKLEIRMT